MKPTRFRRQYIPPKRKINPEAGDRLFVHVDNKWQGAEVVSVNEYVITAKTGRGAASVDFGAYLLSWCWPIDLAHLPPERES